MLASFQRRCPRVFSNCFNKFDLSSLLLSCGSIALFASLHSLRPLASQAPLVISASFARSFRCCSLASRPMLSCGSLAQLRSLASLALSASLRQPRFASSLRSLAFYLFAFAPLRLPRFARMVITSEKIRSVGTSRSPQNQSTNARNVRHTLLHSAAGRGRSLRFAPLPPASRGLACLAFVCACPLFGVRAVAARSFLAMQRPLLTICELRAPHPACECSGRF